MPDHNISDRSSHNSSHTSGKGSRNEGTPQKVTGHKQTASREASEALKFTASGKAGMPGGPTQTT